MRDFNHYNNDNNYNNYNNKQRAWGMEKGAGSRELATEKRRKWEDEKMRK